MIRSLFFTPANRADLIAKLPRLEADCFVIDLEDGTPEAGKPVARTRLPVLLAGLRAEALAGSLYVRVNAAGTPHFAADLAALVGCDIDGVVLPKYESAAPLAEIRARLPARRVIVGLESVRGVAQALQLAGADPAIAGLYFGAEDFIAEMGGRRTPGGQEVLHARSLCALAARAAGIEAIDQGVAAIRDDALFRQDAEAGRDLGYGGKICLLPRQVEIGNRVFAPAAAEIAGAERLLAAAAIQAGAGRGTFDLDGRMVDEPMLRQARRILAAARDAAVEAEPDAGQGT